MTHYQKLSFSLKPCDRKSEGKRASAQRPHHCCQIYEYIRLLLDILRVLNCSYNRVTIVVPSYVSISD